MDRDFDRVACRIRLAQFAKNNNNFYLLVCRISRSIGGLGYVPSIVQETGVMIHDVDV